MKWTPPKRRDNPAWRAASENVVHESVTGLVGVIPGSIEELPAGSVTDMPNRSLPVARARISAAAVELNVLCPDAYSENGGVGNVGFW